MKVEGSAARPGLYPDLSQFYTQGGGLSPSPSPSSSTDLLPPLPPRQRQRPSAPPLDDSVAPEEPEKDYMLDDCSLDREALEDLQEYLYDHCRLDFPHDHPTRRRRDPTLDGRWDYPHDDPTRRRDRRDSDLHSSLDNDCLEEPVELEPDYDTEDLEPDTLLNNLNLMASEKVILHTKNIVVPEPPPRRDHDFRAWMTWRLQANKLLAAVILLRQGRHVHVTGSDIRRKPLTRQNVEKVVQQARAAPPHPWDRDGRRRGSAERTSLPACPYVMYGIPRVNLPRTTQP
ncbi:hypothetical protein ACOMHN_021071 [Nucella lapillus]